MIRLHTSCSTLSIYAFDKISDKSDLRYLVIGWNEFDKVNIDQEKANEIWQDIFNEYIELSDDNKIAMYYATLMEVSQLKARKYTVNKLLDRLVNITDKEMIDAYIFELNKWKFRINKDKPLKDEMVRMYAQLRATNNKINLKEDELKNYKQEGESLSLTEQVVKLENATGRALIDPKTTSVEKWIMIIKNAKVKNKAA
ncbi:MAG: hypothetical protein ABFS35_17785 [Bacteroidota bacterium]